MKLLSTLQLFSIILVSVGQTSYSVQNQNLQGHTDAIASKIQTWEQELAKFVLIRKNRKIDTFRIYLELECPRTLSCQNSTG